MEVSISPKGRDIPCLTAEDLVLVIEKDIQHHCRKHSHSCNSEKLNKHIFMHLISLGTSDESLRHKKNYTAEISKSAVGETQSPKGFSLLGILQKLHFKSFI